ncbi:single myb histone 6-like isoform X1 [Papaver somniferum]|uniref:single myb histone 6-like isoform X1 n=1 Tax=Papaver somniferum TaxID=3469 RepID=UPI000E6F85B8|nr:single myb histone 6-like isoform X1 [Papaver somniferum]
MGAPKQKWTAAEEAALRAGILKHGLGKWRQILKDPEFSGILILRSNVDLKDKWRNIQAPRSFSSADRPDTLYRPETPDLSRARSGYEKSQLKVEPYESPFALSWEARSWEAQSDDDIVDVKPIPVAVETLSESGSTQSNLRLDSLIIEAIANLKERNGSNRTSIATYIEDHYCAPPNFRRILSEKLKRFIASGKLIKVNRNYRIASNSVSSVSFEKSKTCEMRLLEAKQDDSPNIDKEPERMVPEAKQDDSPNIVKEPERMVPEAKQDDSPNIDKDGDKIITRTCINTELAEMRFMTAQQAFAAAARAAAAADEWMAIAEQAAMEAEAAEADAEAAMMTLRARNASVACA